MLINTILFYRTLPFFFSGGMSFRSNTLRFLSLEPLGKTINLKLIHLQLLHLVAE